MAPPVPVQQVKVRGFELLTSSTRGIWWPLPWPFWAGGRGTRSIARAVLAFLRKCGLEEEPAWPGTDNAAVMTVVCTKLWEESDLKHLVLICRACHSLQFAVSSASKDTLPRRGNRSLVLYFTKEQRDIQGCLLSLLIITICATCWLSMEPSMSRISNRSVGGVKIAFQWCSTLHVQWPTEPPVCSEGFCGGTDRSPPVAWLFNEVYKVCLQYTELSLTHWGIVCPLRPSALFYILDGCEHQLPDTLLQLFGTSAAYLFKSCTAAGGVSTGQAKQNLREPERPWETRQTWRNPERHWETRRADHLHLNNQKFQILFKIMSSNSLVTPFRLKTRLRSCATPSHSHRESFNFWKWRGRDGDKWRMNLG